MTQLNRLMALQSPYARDVFNATSDSQHVVICGKLNPSSLSNFCQELFHEDHGNRNLMAVILQKQQPKAEMLEVLQNHQYDVLLRYLQGDPLEEKSLMRADASRANACIVLTDKYVEDPVSQDHKNILLGIAVKNFVSNNNSGKHIRICMQLIKPESKGHFLNFTKGDDQIVVVEEFKMNLLAKSCFCPGIISLLGNLVKSAGDQDMETIQHLYLQEYLTGMGHEIYRVKLSAFFHGKKFVDIAQTVYKELQGIIFCLELQFESDALVVLNPGNFEIPKDQKNNIYVYVICSDKNVADQVTTYNMNVDEPENGPNPYDRAGAGAENQKILLDRRPDWVEEVDNDVERKHINNENINFFELEYVVLDEPHNIMNITKISIQNSSKIKDHIVVCGIHSALYSFILPLRARYLKELMHIVILNPEPPSPELWNQISIFPHLIYVRGSPLVNEDLIRAGIKHAKKAVIMDSGKVNTNDGSRRDKGNDRMTDAESIFIYKAIKKCNPSLQIMIELVYPSNIEFLEPKSTQKEDLDKAKEDNEFKYEYLSLYASGEVYISAIIDTLTCQSYYNPHIVTILKQLLSSGQSSANALKMMGICEEADIKQSNFWQIPVPEDYHNKTFGDLFNYLCIQRALIPIGLYRLPGATDNERPYVYTNPESSVKLTAHDKIFVLGNAMPDDLKEIAPPKTNQPHEEIVPGLNDHVEIEEIEDGNANLGDYERDEIEIHDRGIDANERIESSKLF